MLPRLRRKHLVTTRWLNDSVVLLFVGCWVSVIGCQLLEVILNIIIVGIALLLLAKRTTQFLKQLHLLRVVTAHIDTYRHKYIWNFGCIACEVWPHRCRNHNLANERKLGQANCCGPREPLAKDIVDKLNKEINICKIDGKAQAGDNTKPNRFNRKKSGLNSSENHVSYSKIMTVI